MNGYDDKKDGVYEWTLFRKCYWAFAICFTVFVLGYVAFYAANVKECICSAPIPCHDDECPLGDYYVYTTDSCELACEKVGGFISNITIHDNNSFGNVTLVS